MEFYNLLLADCSTQAAAQSFVRHMLEAANASDNWWPEVTRMFVGQCFRAAGLQCNVTAEQLRETRKFDWRKDNFHYVFLYNPYNFNKVEKFLASLSDVVDQSEEARAVQINSGDCHAELPVSPLLCYIRILTNWFEVVQYVCCPNGSFTWACDRFYLEPLSRLCYHILRGLVLLERKYGAQHATLTDLCIYLSVPVSFGLYFEQAHKDILYGMLALTERYHALFYSEKAELWRFLYYALICEPKSASALFLYRHLKDVIQTWVDEQEKQNCDAHGSTTTLRLLTNNLINEKLMCVYYATLKSQEPKTIVLALLDFLDTLQRHLISAECFTKDFLSVLLLLAIKHHTPMVRTKSAGIYVRIASRLQPDSSLIHHIINVISNSTIVRLPTNDFDKHLLAYVREFVKHLPAIKEFAYYRRLIFEEHINNNSKMRGMAAHMMVTVFRLYQAGTFKSDGYTQFITLICELPMILEKADSPTRYILFNIFFELDCSTLMRCFTHAQQRLSALEDFGLLYFLSNECIEHAYVQHILDSVIRFINITGNVEKLIRLGSALNTAYERLEERLIEFELTEQAPSDMCFGLYYRTLRRLKFMLQANQSHGISLHMLLDTLSYRFLPDCMYKVSIANSNWRIDHDAYETIAMVAILLRDDEGDYNGARLHACVLHMVKCMRKLLMDTITKEVERCKSLFNALAMLLVGFATPNSHGQLRLTQRTYSILLGTLSCVLQSRRPSKAGAANKAHVSFMLSAFNRLLSAQNVKLPNYTIWKLLLHCPTTRQFNKEEEMIIATLLKKQLPNYMRALPVLVHKLHVQKPPMPDLQLSRTLKSHITLIMQKLRKDTSLYLLLHTFLVTLEILVKVLSITNPRIGQNRLRTLKHLPLFIQQVHLSDAVRKNIDDVISKFNTYALSNEERSLLFTFRRGLRKSTSRQADTSVSIAEGDVEVANIMSPTLQQNGDEVRLESAVSTLADAQYLSDLVSSAIQDDNVHVVSHQQEESEIEANQAVPLT